ncbi:response regulator c-di-GMP phosphodiesterase, RpfG family [Poseidonibacter lekithochrous]|nr:HD domain-containing phosphohydrolase [Poseidonibacter lekithochrous]QKJ24426.1 response regulator c-di-GMP phosphodiesterase, RpfG family [Poseidonibacter lekithochrous]
MRSKIKKISIVKKLIIIFSINVIVFLSVILYGYAFTKENTKQLDSIGSELMIVSSYYTNNLKFLENITIIFSDAALTNEIDILENANEKKETILRNFDNLNQMGEVDSLKNKKMFLEYYDFTYGFTLMIIKDNQYFDIEKMTKVKTLTEQISNTFKKDAENSINKLTFAVNQVSKNTNTYFFYSFYLSVVGISILIFNGFFVHILLTRRFDDIISSLKNLALRKPDFSSRLKYDGNDEVDKIKSLVNTLKDKLEDTYHDLEKLKLEKESFLEKEIEDTQKEVVFKMGAIGETRSKETGNHVKRVAEYSKILALEYGLSESDAEVLKQASPMHDIGKVGIPDNILKKPGRLDKDEIEIMKTHSKLGYEMLKGSSRPLLKVAAILAHEHHEKWDGSGYPRGLKGEEINIYGRITAIADVFDALGSNRCYKEAWEDERVYELFRKQRGKHFDPKLVDIFFDKLPLFLEIRDKFKDT